MTGKIPENIFNANKQLISSLPDQPVKLSVKSDGSLYKTGTISSLFSTHVNPQNVIEQTVLESFREKKFKAVSARDIKPMRAFIEGTIHHLDSCKLLTSNITSSLLTEFYNVMYQGYLERGKDPLVAESLVTIEMSQDPLLSVEYKEKIKPVVTSDSSQNGSYFIKNRQGEKIALFKPSDEEIYMENHTRDHRPDPQRNLIRGGKIDGIEIGTFWKREIAASLFPFDVPKTYLLETDKMSKNPESLDLVKKEGSLQEFCPHPTLESLSESRKNKIPVEEVHKLLLFDMIIGNQDRNEANVMYDKEKKILIPIDQGECFNDTLVVWKEKAPENDLSSMLLFYPQAKLLPDPKAVQKFKDMNFDLICSNAARRLSQASLSTLKIRHALIQKALQIEPPLTMKQIFEWVQSDEIVDLCIAVGNPLSTDYTAQVIDKINQR